MSKENKVLKAAGLKTPKNNTNKKENTMKKNAMIVAVSVVVTLIVVAAFTATFRAGASYQRSQDDKVQAAVQAVSKQ